MRCGGNWDLKQINFGAENNVSPKETLNIFTLLGSNSGPPLATLVSAPRRQTDTELYKYIKAPKPVHC